MANLTPVVATKTGKTLTYAAASVGGDTVAVSDQTLLLVKNGSGAAVTVTLAIAKTVSGFAVTPDAVSVAAGGEVVIGPLDPDLFKNSSDSLCHVTYSSVTTVSIAAVTI